MPTTSPRLDLQRTHVAHVVSRADDLGQVDTVRRAQGLGWDALAPRSVGAASSDQPEADE